MPRFSRLILGTLLLLLTAVGVAAPRSVGSGSIQGTVLDTSKAALPGATVTATNVATGVATTRQTTRPACTRCRRFSPGEYRVTVTLDGFQTFVREGLIVDALGWSASTSRCRSAA